MELTAPSSHAEIVHGADHVVEAHEVRPPKNTEDHRAEERSDETLDRLLGRQLDERCAADGYTPHVGEHIVADDERSRHPEPDETFKDVVHDEVTVIRSDEVRR